MQVDWLTVAAQIGNFLILVWLLQRFLYKPIMRAARQREELIETRLAEAKAARSEVDDRARALEEKEAALEASREDVLAQARRDAETLRGRLEVEVRQTIEGKRAAWQDHLATERAAVIASIQRQAGEQVIEITRSIVADYAASDLADGLVARFVAQMRKLKPDTREKMAAAAAREDAKAVIESGLAIDGAAKGRITRAVHEILSPDLEVEYRADPELVLGLRLSVGDHTVEWSAARYLERLQTELGEIVDAASRASASAPEAGRAGGAGAA